MLSSEVDIVPGLRVAARLSRGVEIAMDVTEDGYEPTQRIVWARLDENETRRLVEILTEALA